MKKRKNEIIGGFLSKACHHSWQLCVQLGGRNIPGFRTSKQLGRGRIEGHLEKRFAKSRGIKGQT